MSLFVQIPLLHIAKVPPGIKVGVPKYVRKIHFKCCWTEAGHGKKIMRNPYCLMIL